MNNMPRAPSPRHVNYHRFIAVLGIFLLFSVLVYVGSVSYTGFAVKEPEISFSENQNVFLDSEFEVLGIEKSPNSVLSLELSSDLNLNIFAEIDDCQSWLNGNDKDNQVLHAINSVSRGNFRIGDPSTKTLQQIELYKGSNFCLILINLEYPNSGNVNLKYVEIERNLWKIV